MTPWFEDPEFWRGAAPAIFSSARVAGAQRELDSLLALVAEAGIEVPERAAVLDMPCGVGRHSIELARRGARVTAVDLTAPLLDIARERAAEAGVDVAFVQADMRTFAPEPGAFDLALSLFSSLGYSCDRDDDVATLRNHRAALRSGGALVVDTNAKEIIAGTFQSPRFQEADGYVIEDRAEILDDFGRARSTFIMRRDGVEVHRFTFELALYAASELKAMLREAGFEGAITCFGTTDGRPYGPGAERLIIVARA